MPADPLGALRHAILYDGVDVNDDPVRRILSPLPDKVWVGGYVGKPVTPYAQIRSRGGPRPANWQSEAMRRVDLFCYGKDYNEADNLSLAIDTFLRALYNFEYQHVPMDNTPSEHDVPTNTRIQFVTTESDGIDGIDDDTNLPFLFRSYIIAYCEIKEP